MRMKVSNYIAGQLVAHGISQVFTVTGGGAMHLNDALGHQEGLHCLYQHHEQACAMAAESYARIHNKIGLLCVTTGPGGTNAITGVVGGWLDSIPMLILSGQVRYDTTARWSGTGIRAMGDQEFDIVKAIGCMTKYSEMVIDPMRIRYCLEKALYLAYSGRPGPCWLDIPLNVQGAYVETDELEGFDVEAYEREHGCPAPNLSEETVKQIIEKIRQAKRPVLNPALQLSGIYFMQELRRPVEKEEHKNLRALEEELIANIKKSQFLVAMERSEEEPKKINIPYLKNKDGQILQPVFSDIMEFEKFARGKKLRLAKIPFDKLPTILIEQAEALVINPMGFNLILNRDQLKKING